MSEKCMDYGQKQNYLSYQTAQAWRECERGRSEHGQHGQHGQRASKENHCGNILQFSCKNRKIQITRMDGSSSVAKGVHLF